LKLFNNTFMHQNFKVIIFGSNGQDGFYLVKLLKEKKIDFLCVSRSNSDVNGDVGNYDFVKTQINKFKPTHVFHFAANSTTNHSALFENHESISTGTLNILESVRLICPETKVFISGSAMQFKNNGFPIDEKTAFDPSSPYSVSRIHSVYAARYYRDKFKLKIYIGYFFNHDSPLRKEQHVNQKIINTVKRIAAGSKEKLELGNIDVMKEFNYAADIIDAVWILVTQDKIFEVVLGSGKAHSIREWLEYCFKKVGLDWHNFVILNHNFIPEYKLLVSNPSKIRSLGWKAKVGFHDLADIMLSDNTAENHGK